MRKVTDLLLQCSRRTLGILPLRGENDYRAGGSGRHKQNVFLEYFGKSPRNRRAQIEPCQRKKAPTKWVLFSLVPPVGVEPTRYRYHRILSDSRKLENGVTIPGYISKLVNVVILPAQSPGLNSAVTLNGKRCGGTRKRLSACPPLLSFVTEYLPYPNCWNYWNCSSTFPRPHLPIQANNLPIRRNRVLFA